MVHPDSLVVYCPGDDWSSRGQNVCSVSRWHWAADLCIIQDYTLNLIWLSCRWLIPFIGHMGICTSSGVIRDFAGPYFVSVSFFCTHLICDRIWEKEALRAKLKFLPLFKLSPHQGLQSPWLPASFTDTSCLLLHRSNVESYSMPSVSSGELPKWGIKRVISNRG